MLNHPNVHVPWSSWSEDQALHVASAYSNPFRWRTRRELANNFRRHMLASPNVVLHFGELAYGDRPFEVTGDHPSDVQLRTACELWHKENILNRVIQTFPPDWRYGMICDADFHMTRPDWALETVQQLQHYDFIQPFSSYVDVAGAVYGQAQLPLRANTAFFFNYVQNGFKVSPVYHNATIGPDGKILGGKPGATDSYTAAMLPEGVFMRGTGATGGALAFRRSAFEAVGGLLDRCILGHADWYMAYQLVDVEPPDIHSQKYHPDYQRYVTRWGARAARLNKNVGYVDGMALHFFHGSKTRRAYSSRDAILAKHQFNPYEDLHSDFQGIWKLNPNKPALRDDIRQYFISRSEDDPNLYLPERSMV